MANPSIIITKLEDLTLIRDEAFSSVFCENLDKVFKYGEMDIKAILDTKTVDLIKGIRAELIAKLNSSEVFKAYARKCPVDRKVKNTLYQDIIALGKSLSKMEGDPNLDKVFIKNTPEAPIDLTDQTQLIATIHQMRAIIEELKSSLEEARSERDALDSRVTFLENSSGKFDDLKVSTEDKTYSTVAVRPAIATPDSEASDFPPSSSDTEDDEVANGFIKVNPKKLKKKKSQSTKTKNPQAKPVEAGHRRSFAYVGGVNPANTRYDILVHVNTFSKVKLELSDIQVETEKPGLSKSFKIAVPEGKINEIVDIFEKRGLKAGPYYKPKPKRSSATHQSVTPTNVSRNKRKRKFRGQHPQQHIFRNQQAQWGTQASPI